MKPFQKRVVVEKNELAEKLRNLALFLGSEEFFRVDQDERTRMLAQYGAMKTYCDILRDRIVHFED